LEHRWILRLNTLHPAGINTKIQPSSKIPLILPFSSSNRKLGSSIINCISDNLNIKPFISYTRHRNLKEILCPSKVTTAT
jgi:hypothetical protein